MTLLTTLARLEAAASGRARPLSRVRHRRLAGQPLVIIPLTLAGDPATPGRRHDRNQPRQPSSCSSCRSPATATCGSASWPTWPGSCSATSPAGRTRPRCSLRPGTARSGAGTPTRRRSSSQPGRTGLPRPAGPRPPGSSRPTGPTPSIPSVPVLGRWLTFLADRADHPGAALLADLTSLLAEHWATGQSPLEDAQPRRPARLDRPAAGHDRSAGRARHRGSAALPARRARHRPRLRPGHPGAAGPQPRPGERGTATSRHRPRRR